MSNDDQRGYDYESVRLAARDKRQAEPQTEYASKQAEAEESAHCLFPIYGSGHYTKADISPVFCRKTVR